MSKRLEEISNGVDSLLTAGLLDTAYDLERERAYQRAVQVHQQLDNMQSTLSDVVKKLNESSQSVNDTNNPVNQIVKVCCHLKAHVFCFLDGVPCHSTLMLIVLHPKRRSSMFTMTLLPG